MGVPQSLFQPRCESAYLVSPQEGSRKEIFLARWKEIYINRRECRLRQEEIQFFRHDVRFMAWSANIFTWFFGLRYIGPKFLFGGVPVTSLTWVCDMTTQEDLDRQYMEIQSANVICRRHFERFDNYYHYVNDLDVKEPLWTIPIDDPNRYALHKQLNECEAYTSLLARVEVAEYFDKHLPHDCDLFIHHAE